MNPFLQLATATGTAAAGAVGLESVLSAVNQDPSSAGPIIGSIGVGATVWAIKELLRLRRDVDEFRRESRHSRKVIANKLGLPQSDLEIPE